MNKTELTAAYNILDQIHSEFSMEYSDFRNGSNAKIRSKAERNIDNIIDRACYYIQHNETIYYLLVGENSSDYSKAIAWDEFKSPSWFGRDLAKLLRDIKEKINQVED